MAPSLLDDHALSEITKGSVTSPLSNQSVVWAAPSKVELLPREVSEPGDNEVLIQVIVTGICGSDCHVWESNPAKQPPVLGHESAGVIMRIGSKVTDREVGQRVAIEPGVPCLK